MRLIRVGMGMLRSAVISLAICLNFNQAEAQELSVQLKLITAQADSIMLRAGFADSATAGLDGNLAEMQLPAPMANKFDARFVSQPELNVALGTGTHIDFRPTPAMDQGAINYLVSIQDPAMAGFVCQIVSGSRIQIQVLDPLADSLLADLAAGHHRLDLSGRSVQQLQLRITHTGFQVPDASAQISPEDAAEDVPLPVILSWQKSQAALVYRVQVLRAGGFLSLLRDTLVTDTTVVLAGLPPDQKCLWRVQALAGDSLTGTWSANRQFRTSIPAGPPEIPVLLAPANGEMLTDLFPVLRWQDVPFAAMYDLQVLTGSALGQLAIDETDIDQSVYRSQNLESSRNYFWRVRASNRNGKSEWSKPFKFSTPSSTTGVEAGTQSILDAALIVWPNPWKEQLFARLPNAGFLHWQLISLQGKVVAMGKKQLRANGLLRIQPATLSAGVYLLVVRQGSDMFVHKTVVMP